MITQFARLCVAAYSASWYAHALLGDSAGGARTRTITAHRRLRVMRRG
jgi:hypothetical protein